MATPTIFPLGQQYNRAATDAALAGKQPLDADLTALAANTANGLLAKTGAGTVSSRTITGSTGLSVTDGDGVAGNPTLTLDADVVALANNSTDGFWAHTAAGTGAARTLTGTEDQIGVTNGDGVSGNPILAFLGKVLAFSNLVAAADKLAYFTGASTMALTDLVSQARSFLADPRATFVAYLRSGTGALARTLQSWLDDHVNVKDFAVGDGIQFSDGAITTGTDDFTSASSAFTVNDVGKIFVLEGAGAAGATLLTTISAYVSPTAVTLADNASTTVSGAMGCYGTDDAAAILAAQAVLTAMGGGILDFPAGGYLFASQLTGAADITWSGRGKSTYIETVAPTSLLRAFSTTTALVGVGDNFRFDNMGMVCFGLSGNGVEVHGSRFGSRDASIASAGNDNLRIGSDDSGNVFNMNLWRVENPTIMNAGRYGIFIHDAKALPDVNAGKLADPDVSNCGDHGIYLDNAWDCKVEFPASQTNGGTGIRVGGSSENTTIDTPYTEANLNNEITIDAGALYTRIDGVRSNVVASGYVDNGTYTQIKQTRDGIAGWFYNNVLIIGGLGAGNTARLMLYAGVNEINAGTLVGRDGTTGSAGEVAIQVKRNGNTPIDRMVLTDGSVVVPDTTDIRLGSASGPRIFYGSGSPEGAITAVVGSSFHRTDGGAVTAIYIKESGTGNTGWVAK